MTNSLIPSVPTPPSFLDDPEYLKLIEKDLETQSGMMHTVDLPPFKKLSVPSRGGMQFEYREAPKSSPVFLNHFIGHIVKIQYFRQWWQNNHVICQSDDSKISRATGVRYPKTVCDTCPHGQFANLPGGISKKPDCSKKARLYIIPCLFNPADKTYAYTYSAAQQPDGTLAPVNELCGEPIYMDVPPTSLKSLQDFFNQCNTFGPRPLPFTVFVALFTIQEAKNKDGQPYAKLVIQPRNVVPPHGLLFQKQILEKYDLDNTAIPTSTTEGEDYAVTSQNAAPVPGQAAPAAPAQSGAQFLYGGQPAQQTQQAQQGAAMFQQSAQGGQPQMGQPAPVVAPSPFQQAQTVQPTPVQTAPVQPQVQQPAQQVQPNGPAPAAAPWLMGQPK